MKRWQKITGIIALASILLLFGSCSRIANKVKEIKSSIGAGIDEIFDEGFYRNPGGRDYCRFPLIAPYELLSLNSSQGIKHWDIVKTNTSSGYAVSGTCLLSSARKRVEYVGVTDSIIYCKYTSELRDEYNDKESWWNMEQYVIVDTRNDVVIPIEDELNFIGKLKQLGIQKPLLFSTDSIYSEFLNDKKKLLFNPADYETDR